MSSHPIKQFVAILAIIFCFGAAAASNETKAIRLVSPNGRLAVDFHLDAAGAPRYAIHPGKLVVLARKGEGRWYIAGINGEATGKKLKLNLSELPIRGSGTLITDTDGGNLSFRQEKIVLTSERMLEVTLKPQGGFVIVF
jgi:hypothetical protein